MDIVMNVYKLCKALPDEERFGLATQMRRCSVSISSNIAEGSAKRSKKEYIKFLEISLGSAFELETQVLITDKLGYGDKELRQQILSDLDEEQKMLQGFINTVEKP